MISTLLGKQNKTNKVEEVIPWLLIIEWHFLEQLSKYVVEKDKDFLKEALTLLINALMDAEVTSIIGAEKYERNNNRNNYRNGYRLREWDTRVGTLQLSIPKLRHGSYFPSLLEPRKMSEKALLNVVQEAYVHGVSTRKVDELVEALGMKGIDKAKYQESVSNWMNL